MSRDGGLITCPCDSHRSFSVVDKKKCFDCSAFGRRARQRKKKMLWGSARRTDMYFLLISSHASCLMLIIKESFARLYKNRLMFIFSIFLLLLTRLRLNRAFAVERHKCCVYDFFLTSSSSSPRSLRSYVFFSFLRESPHNGTPNRKPRRRGERTEWNRNRGGKGRRKTKKNHTLLKRLGKLRSNNEKTPKEKEKKKRK